MLNKDYEKKPLASNTNKDSISFKPGTLINYALCVALLPFVIMLYLYQKNIQYLSLWQVLVLCLIMTVFLLAAYYISRIFTKFDFSAFLFTSVIFILFFMYRSLERIFMQLPISRLIITGGLLCAFIFVAVIVAYISLKFKERLKSENIKLVVFVMISAMLIQNIAVIVTFASKQKTNEMFYKEAFNINSSLEQPNVYWIHCDGMLSFDSMLRFFGDDQEGFTGELESRGFWINREASFEAGRSTQWAIPTLMSPYYYDRVLSWKFDPIYAEATPLNEDLINSQRIRLEANFTSNRMAREENETVMAFNAAGYNTSTISSISIYFYPTVNQFYNLSVSQPLMTTKRPLSETMAFINNISNFGSLFDLLYKTSPIPGSEHPMMRRHIFQKLNTIGFTNASVEHRVDLFSDLNVDRDSRESIESYNKLADCLYDSLERNSPQFSILDYGMAHRPFYYDELGNFTADDADNPMRYPAHHTFSANTLLKYIDIILEHDPDAVIVLQADHGLHELSNMGGIETIMEAFSCTEDEAQALWNQTMSAVRLPEAKMTQDTQKILSDPRNISRYLINNFVGENYDYIPYQYKQIFTGPELSGYRK